MEINVSGEIFIIPRYRLKQWPQTLLGSPAVERFYRPELGMYFFDRNRSVFEYICRFYQSDDDVEFPPQFDDTVLEMELEFFKIGWSDLNKSFKTSDFEYVGRKEKAFAFFNDHKSSVFAFCYMIFEFFVIALSVVDFILEEDEAFQSFLSDQPILLEIREIGVIPLLGVLFFSVDFIARAIVTLDQRQFIMDITTWFDILALLPYYLDLASVQEEGHKEIQVLMILKIFRVARCLKIIRRSERLQIILKILGGCRWELLVMLFVWIVGALFAGSLGYVTENGLSEMLYNKTNPEFSSILESTWWAQVTMASIGYGDMYPKYGPGKLMATIVIIGSTILTAIPMTFIVRRFSLEYEKVAMKERPWKILGSEEVKMSRNSDHFQKRRFEEKCGENVCYAAVLAYRKKNATKVWQETLFTVLLREREAELINESEENLERLENANHSHTGP
ncbi:potassium voltage-gated channel subfamily A member 1-like [Bolinopsis microptera]|uniref:potassium voltage-gated channel subfamily A member 1-like n=1 Tax=Bolinopsis microptera TaxID=2820187 RepID=UPI00307A6CE1